MRRWDSQAENGYKIEAKKEMAYDFIGWYQVLEECDGSTGEVEW